MYFKGCQGRMGGGGHPLIHFYYLSEEGKNFLRDRGLGGDSLGFW